MACVEIWEHLCIYVRKPAEIQYYSLVLEKSAVNQLNGFIYILLSDKGVVNDKNVFHLFGRRLIILGQGGKLYTELFHF